MKFQEETKPLHSDKASSRLCTQRLTTPKVAAIVENNSVSRHPVRHEEIFGLLRTTLNMYTTIKSHAGDIKYLHVDNATKTNRIHRGPQIKVGSTSLVD